MNNGVQKNQRITAISIEMSTAIRFSFSLAVHNDAVKTNGSGGDSDKKKSSNTSDSVSSASDDDKIDGKGVGNDYATDNSCEREERRSSSSNSSGSV